MAAKMPILSDERLVRLLNYWSDLRDGRWAPSRADFDPLDLPDLLPALNLVDVLYDPLRFRHRLVGTGVVEAMGRDETGRLVDEDLYGAVADDIIRGFARLVREIRPFRRCSRLGWNGRDWTVLEAVELPLVDDDGRVCMIPRGSSFSSNAQSFEVERSYEPIGPIEKTTLLEPPFSRRT